MTYSINDSIETSQNGFNRNNINTNISFHQSTEIMNGRDYRRDRKLLQFNRLSRTLQVCFVNIYFLNNAYSNIIVLFFAFYIYCVFIIVF